jgi:hypothetical protein
MIDGPTVGAHDRGHHDTIVAEPNVGLLAARLRACLDDAAANQDGERGSQGW